MKILVVFAAPNTAAEVRVVDNTLEAFQALVGGDIELHWHEALRSQVRHDLHIYINEYGKRLALPMNLTTTDDVILGPLIVSRHDSQGEDCGLDTALAERAARWLDMTRGITKK